MPRASRKNMVSETRDVVSSPDAEWTLGRSFESSSVVLPNTVNFIFSTFKKYYLSMYLNYKSPILRLIALVLKVRY